MGAVVLTKRPLGASVPYPQDKQDRFHDTDPVGGVRGHIYSDQAGTLYLEESDDDGATWSTTSTVAVSASVTAKLDWTAMSKRWYRFRYVNGATAQTKFVLIQQTRGMELDDVQLSGSNFEQTTGQAVPNKAVLLGLNVGGVMYAPTGVYTPSIGDSAGNGGSLGLSVNSASLVYNGTTWDRRRNNTEGTLLASAARTASGNSADLTVHNSSKLAVYLDVTAASGTSPTLDVTVKAKDPVSGKYFTIGTFAQKTGVASEAIFIGGGADVEFAVRTYRIEYVIAGTSPSFTFSVGASMSVS